VRCILEVDLEYTDELHDLHNGYPLAPESTISPAPKTIEGIDEKIPKVSKLIPTLNNKTNYVLHYKSLLLYEKLGLKITKIHGGIRFKESTWLRKYIDKNIELRTKAKNEFEKDFFKLMNNSVYGKTMENVRNRVDIRLVNTKYKGKNWLRNQTSEIVSYLTRTWQHFT